MTRGMPAPRTDAAEARQRMIREQRARGRAPLDEPQETRADARPPVTTPQWRTDQPDSAAARHRMIETNRKRGLAPLGE